MGALALAFVAGLISVTSPWCLPLLPGYLSYVGGAAGPDSGGVGVRRRTIGAGVLFVTGFTIAFVILGVSASVLGRFLIQNRAALLWVAGGFVTLMGLSMIGLVRIPFLMREQRFDMRKIRSGPAGAIPLGMAFAIGWTPCIGPVLAAILTAAAAAGTAWWGALLLFVYSLGLGVPFVALAAGYSSQGRLFRFLRRHGRGIEILGGSLLVTMGVLMISGWWLRLFIPVLRLYANFKWPPW